MPGPFSQTVIAVVWDFDKTLIPGNMQSPLFAHYGVDERAFWDEVDALAGFYLAHGARRVAEDALYLNHILEYVRDGAFAGLSNETLHELGAELTFHPGVPEFLDTLRRSVEDDPIFERADITLEHYVVSTGLRPMIEGSAVRPHLTDVWACEFIEAHHPPGYARPEQKQLFPRREITALGYQIDNTSKTRALFEINKGTNKRPEIHVNSHLPHELRRVPFEHMIYVADGPSDVPAWSVVRANGGMAFGVYQRGSLAQFEQISALQRDGRIHAFAEADYTPDSTAYLWLTTEVRRIADKIVEERETALRRAVRRAPRHVDDAPAPTPTDEPMEQPEVGPRQDREAAARSASDELRDRIRRRLDADGEDEPAPAQRDSESVPVDDR
ncbi:MAG TPA: HAD family hydrolase [Candidatus Limnocylindrales bacterium]|nr:HAD family hydrolase [Candidatus Limnocylindrales bacterium]